MNVYLILCIFGLIIMYIRLDCIMYNIQILVLSSHYQYGQIIKYISGTIVSWVISMNNSTRLDDLISLFKGISTV